MATFNDILSEFKSRLNRDDCTDQLATYLIADAQRVAQRDLRIPSMERSRFILAQGPMSFVSVPDDLLEVIDIYAGACGGPAKPLERAAFRQVSAIPLLSQPKFYARLGGTFQFRGQIPPEGSVEIIYYGNVANFTDGDSTNELSLVCPDVLVYGALKFAGDHFDHPSTQAWQQTYQGLIEQVQGSAVDLENTGGPACIEPIYRWEQ